MERRRDRSRSRDRERDKDRNRTSRDDRGSRRKRSRSSSRDALKDGKRSRRSRSRSRDKQDYRGTRDSRDDRGRKDNGRDDRDVDRSRKDSGREERDADRSRKDSGRDSRSDRGGKPREDKNLDGIKAEEVVLPPKQEEESYVPRPKVEPLSLEEILNKRQQAKELDAKPKFLSKKEREALALKRREEEVQLQKARADMLHKDHDSWESRKEKEAKQREMDRKADEDRKEREQERERVKMQEIIKQQYLGGEKKKKKMLKPSEKFKFNFDWEAGDDTSRDLNPLYNSTHEAALLFGRGVRAGVDRREQKKAAAEFERDMLRKIRESQGVKETREDRRRDRVREEEADGYAPYDIKEGKHWTEKSREEMTERDWRIFREDYNIAYKSKGDDPSTNPLRNWAEANLPDRLMQSIEKLGYTKPSPIQMAAIPLGLKQRDVIGIAETGSGKTAAFVLPMLVYIMDQPAMDERVAQDGPYAVVLAPTRELAQQIEEEATKLAQFTSFRVVAVVGGVPIEEQGVKLRKGCEIVVATPGRLLDCLGQAYAVLNQCNYVVLDEADRMIDMGFEPQVIGVLDAMPSSNLKPESEEVELETNRVYRTTYMFSATMPPTVERLARKYLRRPCVVNIGSAGRATDNVTQKVYMLKDNEKAGRLEIELDAVGDKLVIVFVNTKHQCDTVCNQLEYLQYSVTQLHGSKSQDQREASLKGFREGKYTVLVATDVAGRGIDVNDVALVVNYDMPNTVDAYTHRIGRTGRAGKKGTAVTFLTLGDTEVFFDLKKLLEESKAVVPPQLASHEAARIKPGGVGERRRDQTVYARTD